MKFEVSPPSFLDKKLAITSSDGNRDRTLWVDFDDVDEATQLSFAKEVAEVLTAHFYPGTSK